MSAVLALDDAPAPAPAAPCLRVLNVLQPMPGLGKAAPAQGEVFDKLMQLRDEFARIASDGRFMDAAAREWRTLPRSWREDLLTLAGLGDDLDTLQLLAGRDWHEIPPPERGRISGVVRSAKRYLAPLVALAAKG